MPNGVVCAPIAVKRWTSSSFPNLQVFKATDSATSPKAEKAGDVDQFPKPRLKLRSSLSRAKSAKTSRMPDEPDAAVQWAFERLTRGVALPHGKDEAELREELRRALKPDHYKD